MVFTDIDLYTLKSLCTLAMISEKTNASTEALVHVGQHLGVPKDDTLVLLSEWDENDIMRLKSEDEKRRFVDYCFSFMDADYQPATAEMKLYHSVISELGLQARFNN